MANASLENLAAGQKAILDTVQAFVGISLDSFEKAASHHLASSRQVLELQIRQGKDILDSKDIPGALALGGTFLQPYIDNNIDYLRGIHDISNATQEQLIGLIERSHGELNKSVSSALDWYAQSTGHADVAVRSAVSAANTAFENAHNTVRQVANIADASVKAATSATSRALETSNPSRKKAA